MPFIWLGSIFSVANLRSCICSCYSCTHTYMKKLSDACHKQCWILSFVLCCKCAILSCMLLLSSRHVKQKKNKYFVAHAPYVHYHSWFAINSLLVMMIHKMSIFSRLLFLMYVHKHFHSFLYFLALSVCMTYSRKLCHLIQKIKNHVSSSSSSSSSLLSSYFHLSSFICSIFIYEYEMEIVLLNMTLLHWGHYKTFEEIYYSILRHMK